jgi:hypothetical protein
MGSKPFYRGSEWRRRVDDTTRQRRGYAKVTDQSADFSAYVRPATTNDATFAKPSHASVELAARKFVLVPPFDTCHSSRR